MGKSISLPLTVLPSLVMPDRLNARGFCTLAGFPPLSFPTQSLLDIPGRSEKTRMQAYIYKSQRKDDTFVYLAARDDFERLPEPLRSQLGELKFVLDVALTPERRLAREDVHVVRANLAERGFHIQFPPTLTGDERADA